MEDAAMAGWLSLAMDRVSNFVRILWLSGLVEGTDLEPEGDDTCVGRLSECILRGSIDDCRLLIFEWVIGPGRRSVKSTIKNRPSSIVNQRRFFIRCNLPGGPHWREVRRS